MTKNATTGMTFSNHNRLTTYVDRSSTLTSTGGSGEVSLSAGGVGSQNYCDEFIWQYSGSRAPSPGGRGRLWRLWEEHDVGTFFPLIGAIDLEAVTYRRSNSQVKWSGTLSIARGSITFIGHWPVRYADGWTLHRVLIVRRDMCLSLVDELLLENGVVVLGPFLRQRAWSALAAAGFRPQVVRTRVQGPSRSMLSA